MSIIITQYNTQNISLIKQEREIKWIHIGKEDFKLDDTVVYTEDPKYSTKTNKHSNKARYKSTHKNI